MWLQPSNLYQQGSSKNNLVVLKICVVVNLPSDLRLEAFNLEDLQLHNLEDFSMHLTVLEGLKDLPKH